MPAITSGKVLVTGANGFIAGWVVKTLLERGFAVRGTVRSAEKADALRRVLSEHGERLEFVIVEDITKEGAFDDAVKGIDAIVHAAAPQVLAADDPEELIRPAVRAATGILHSASRSAVKRVVSLSTAGAVAEASRSGPVVFTEADWNESDVAAVKNSESADEGSSSTDSKLKGQKSAYQASKTLAERAAWDVYNQGRGGEGTRRIGWDLATLCPPWVFGPVLGANAPEQLNFSVGTWFRLVVKGEGMPPQLGETVWTDVRDLAEASVRALTKPEAGGERFIVSTGNFVWEDWGHITRCLLGMSNAETSGNIGSSEPLNVRHRVMFDSGKSQDVLGLEYRRMEETAAFMVADFKAKGWC